MPDQLEQWGELCRLSMQKDVVDRFMTSVETFITNCPVVTGRTLNSFRATINEPATNTDPGEGVHDKTGEAVLDQCRMVAESANPGDQIFFGSDYWAAEVVENGTAKKKPHLMVEAGAQVWGD